MDTVETGKDIEGYGFEPGDRSLGRLLADGEGVIAELAYPLRDLLFVRGAGSAAGEGEASRGRVRTSNRTLSTARNPPNRGRIAVSPSFCRRGGLFLSEDVI